MRRTHSRYSPVYSVLTALCLPAWAQQGPPPPMAPDGAQRRMELRHTIEAQRAANLARDVRPAGAAQPTLSLSPQQRAQLREELRRQSSLRPDAPSGPPGGR